MAEHARRKLSEDDVRSIRERYDPGIVSYKTLADEYGVTRATIAAIIARRTWVDLDTPGEAAP